MFKLICRECKLVSVNPRAELHDEETRMACDLKISMTGDNDLLDRLCGNLKKALYKAADDSADLADQGMDDDYLPTLRYPDLKAVTWGYTGTGYRVVISTGLDTDSEIYLIQTTIDKFKIVPQSGGIVELHFRIIAHPNEKDMGALCRLIQTDICLTLEPPGAERQAEMKLEKAKNQGTLKKAG